MSREEEVSLIQQAYIKAAIEPDGLDGFRVIRSEDKRNRPDKCILRNLDRLLDQFLAEENQGLHLVS
jgi:hypothetical protein